jgi:hypothetical protein
VHAAVRAEKVDFALIIFIKLKEYLHIKSFLQKKKKYKKTICHQRKRIGNNREMRCCSFAFFMFFALLTFLLFYWIFFVTAIVKREKMHVYGKYCCTVFLPCLFVSLKNYEHIKIVEMDIKQHKKIFSRLKSLFIHKRKSYCSCMKCMNVLLIFF